MKRVAHRFTVALLVALGLAITFPASVFALKVAPSPTSSTIIEGGQQVVSFTLDEPILAPPPDPAYVTLIITPSSPSRVSLSSTTLTWSSSEWFASKTITISAVNDALDNGDAAVTFSVLADSNSEYYQGYSNTFTITVLDNDDPSPVVVADQTTSSPTATLAETGQPVPLAAVVLTLGVLLSGWVVRKSINIL